MSPRAAAARRAAPSTTIPGTTEPGATPASVEFDISHSYRGDLDVSAGVVDADGNSLCEPVGIHEPNPQDNAQDLSGAVDVSESECAEFLPPARTRSGCVRA